MREISHWMLSVYFDPQVHSVEISFYVFLQASKWRGKDSLPWFNSAKLGGRMLYIVSSLILAYVRASLSKKKFLFKLRKIR